MANTIDITFLGTSSAQPSTTRNHSSLGVRMNGTVWLFDAGEGTQRQLMYSTLKMGKVNKIFITHLHGDHIYGLPGLICTLTAALNPQNHTDKNWDEEETAKDPENTPCLEIYGPEGLRNYIRCALMYTYSRLPIYYRVHELIIPEQEAKEIDQETTSPDKREFLSIRQRFHQHIPSDILHPDELLGEDIQADSDGLFRDLLQLEKKNISGNKRKNFKGDPLLDKIRVSASYIKHSVPTLGYVLEECSMKGNVKMELIKPILTRNKEALASQGIKQPLSLLRDLKNGKTLHLPDGSILDPKEVITPTEQRKIVILGDTYNPYKITPLAQNPTILIHEATNMYEGEEKEEEKEKVKEKGEKKKSETEIETNTKPKEEKATTPAISAAEQYRLKVMSRGHSTPEMAGAFASHLGAQYLILNHFSSRYSSLNRMAIVSPNWENPTMKMEAQRHCSSSSSSSSSSIPFPRTPEKRDNLSEKEKLQLQKVNDHGLTLTQQKLLDDWLVLEKIRGKAASTFKPLSLDHIILADDYLQVECNRQKVQLNQANTTLDRQNTNQKTQSSSSSDSIPIYRAWNHDIVV